MGDAGLSKDRKNAHLFIGHSQKQKDYALWKKEILEHITSVSEWYGQTEADGKKYDVMRIWTKSHPFYTSLRNRMYFRNRKTFDMHCLKRMTELGFLIWYLDDGTRDKSAIRLCTDRYNYIEHLSLQKWFHDRWGLTCRLNRHGKHWRLRFPKSEVEKIDFIFAPFLESVPKCMQYKLNLQNECHA